MQDRDKVTLTELEKRRVLLYWEAYQNEPKMLNETNSTHKAWFQNETCGDWLDLYLRREPDGRLSEITAYIRGCAYCVAGYSLLRDYLINAYNPGLMTKEEMLNLFGAHEAGREECVLLAWNALQKALK
jgi:NifU-like protein involved in Fe-S cluster formation